MSYRYLELSGTEQVRRLALARPEVRNAFDADLIAELTEALRELAEHQELRALILAAEGNTFCAGADFRWMSSLKNANLEANEEDAKRLFDMFYALHTFPAPTIARVQGNAFGGGAGLIACCDFVVMAEEAALAFSEVKIGLIPATISPFVVRRTGAAKATEVFLTGQTIPAWRAWEIGLADRVVTLTMLDTAVDEVVDLLLKGGALAQRMAKRLVREIAQLPLDEARTPTAEAIAVQRVSAEGQEGMAAFLEKRKPEWLGGDTKA
jgi:methylglutaconyl-CoA hydratase